MVALTHTHNHLISNIMAIKISTHDTDSELYGKSKWWGCPDLPKGVPYPCYEPIPDYMADDEHIADYDEDESEDTLTFICQINLQDIAPYDVEGLLPHTGMLYFFAQLDYFMGDLDAPSQGLGFWQKGAFRVIYSPKTTALHTHRTLWADGTPAYRPARAITFSRTDDHDYGHRLLGMPYYEEVSAEAPGMLSLLQIDEDDTLPLRLYDLGTLNFLITPTQLKSTDFTHTKLYFHSL